MLNFYTPLTSQVEALALPPESINSLSLASQLSLPLIHHLIPPTNPPMLPTCLAQHSTRPRRPHRRLTFSLPAAHVDRNSKAWRRSPRSRTPRRHTVARPLRLSPSAALSRPLTEQQLKSGVLDGTIPSAAWDTACTSHAGKLGDPFIPTTKLSSKVFALADGHPAPATHVAKLHHRLREPARTVDIVPALKGNSLLSGGKFAEAGYISICDGDEVNIYDGRTAKITISEEAVLRGWRCPHQNLWRVPLQANVTNLNQHTLLLDGPTGTESLNSLYAVPSSAAMVQHIKLFSRPNPSEAINNVYELPSIERAVRYLHGAAGFPTKATWLKSIRAGNYLTWPLITVKHVHKYFPESEETQKGHMRNQRQGVRSTKRALTTNISLLPAGGSEAVENFNDSPTQAGGAAQILRENFQFSQCDARGAAQIPAQPPSNLIEVTAIEKKKDVFIALYEPKATMFTDQTGRFPQQSSHGNNYQMILHDIDSNSTWVEPMKNRTEGEMILGRRRALAHMKVQGIIPSHQVLDNEISAAYRAEIQATGMTYQLVPPDDHRRNVAEKAIQTWKDHFVGVLSGTADTFPLHLWCQAIPQMERQLLLLRQSNSNPKISAYAQVYGQHDYDAAPFVPIGMETLVHEKPHRRRSFAEHCKKGYVLGTSFEHYRAWTIWMTDTRAQRVSGTVFHKHKYPHVA